MPSLNANENQTADQKNESQINHIPVQNPTTSRKNSNAKQRGTKDNPLFVDVIKPAKTDTEAAREQKEHDEKLALDRKTVALNDKPVTLNEKTVEFNSQVARFTGYVAGLAFLQCLVLIAQAWFNYRQTNYQRITERAYVFARVDEQWNLTPSPSDSEMNTIVQVKFINHGKTPAIIRMMGGQLVVSRTAPDVIPREAETEHWAEGYTIAHNQTHNFKLHIHSCPK